MVTDVRQRFNRLIIPSGAAIVALSLTGLIWGQQSVAPSSSGQEAREKAKEKIDAAKESKQGARETTRPELGGGRTEPEAVSLSSGS